MEGCAWDIYDDNTRKVLGFCIFVTGLFSVILSSWLLTVLMKKLLACDRSYLTLLNLSVASVVRTLLGGFLFSGLASVSHRWIFGETSCKLFGFLIHFTGIYQVEALTHMCIERYVVAKYISNGWEVTKDRYVLFTALCWMFSILYSVPALFGYGGYWLDYSCSACTLDLILPSDSWSRIVVVVILLLGSVKPLLVMSMTLLWARELEIKCYNEKEHRKHLLLTKSTAKVTWATLCCWTPGAMATVWVVASQLIYGELVQPPMLLALLASIGSEVAPGVIVLAVFYSNAQAKRAMEVLLGEPTHIKDA